MAQPNPSNSVAPALQNHVHLVSGHRYPLVAGQLSVDQALTYLLDAPTIVKSLAPMSWQYFHAPPDGSLWLEYIPPEKDRFASDGYVWGDPEMRFHMEHNGYTIEAYRHSIGYRPLVDQLASHARTRYHIIAKDPNIPAAKPDPTLWIVHYHAGDRNRMLPASQVPLPPQMHQIMRERQALEAQGRIDRRDFMLHDRGSWPTLNVPNNAAVQRQMSMQQQPAYYPPNVQGRYPPYNPMTQAHLQQPPAKRQRTNAAAPGAGVNLDAMHGDTTIEDEESTILGDFFDHLTPRDISVTRYTQHHRWMEEVFSSPYASHQIVPADLGLGLMGELKSLTDGILEAPVVDLTFTEKQPTKAKEAEPFTNLSQEKIEEFNGRVAKYLEEGQAEIEQMKAEHAQRMSEWKKSKMLMQAEKRLRYATWEGHESAVAVFRLDEPASNGHIAESGKHETVEDIIAEVETTFGVKIVSRKEAELIEKGGLEKDEDILPQSLPVTQLQDQQQPGMFGQTQQISNARPGELYVGQPNQQPQNPMSQKQAAQEAAEPTSTAATEPVAAETVDALGDEGLNDTSMMEGMDLDMGDTSIDFGDSGLDAADFGANDDTAIATVDQTATADASANPSTAMTTTAQQQQQQQQMPAALTDTTTPAGQNNIDDEQGAGEDSIFNDTTFGDLTNMDDEGGDDDLFNFGDDNMGMDDGAFGDAMHGMDENGGVGEEGAGSGAAGGGNHEGGVA